MLERYLPENLGRAWWMQTSRRDTLSSRKCAAESVTGPITKLSHGGSVTVYRDPVCFVASNFRVQEEARTYKQGDRAICEGEPMDQGLGFYSDLTFVQEDRGKG